MYVEFFGLEQNPFRARADGNAVFVGPQQAKVLSGLKKALSEPDAVATVTGPVGVGKTTSATRALDTISSSKAVARIGRMQLGREEILELLLHELGASGPTTNTLQRFSAFKRLLNDREDENVRVFIVVEDATRIGLDGLAELESVTSADSGETSGANVILMGPPDLNELLKAPQLVRLSQRIRFRHSIEPFTQAEIRGYVAHRIRAAGGTFESMFAADAIDAVHRCSAGIPRVVNSLCSAALNAAADAKSAKLSAELIERVAREEFGLEPEQATSAENADLKGPKDALPEPGQEAPAPIAMTPVEAAPIGTPDPIDAIDIPDLIQDTLPAFEALTEPKKQFAEPVVELRDGTDDGQAPLPVLDLADGTAAKPDPSNDAGVAERDAEELRIILEPRAPEPLSKSQDPADTQTIKALDSALRPDTQLLEALDDTRPPVESDAPPPQNLPNAPLQEPAGSEQLPTLSESMRLTPPPASTTDSASPVEKRSQGEAAKKPDVDALESALAVARKGPIDLNPDSAAQAAAPITQQTPTTSSTPADQSTPPSAPAKHELPVTESVPEITLEDSMQRQQEAARARLAEEAASVAAAAKTEAEPSEAELAAAAELAAEKERLAGMNSISDQFSIAEELSLDDLGSTTEESAPKTEAAVETTDEDREDQEKLQKLAAELGNARSLEDIDDLAAETLFGQEFSQMAAAVAAMAANDMESDGEAEPVHEPGDARPSTTSGEPAATPNAAAAPTAPTAPEPVQKAAPLPAATETAAAAVPEMTRKPVPPKVDIDASAARRLEMVRSLNQNRPPAASAPLAEEIDLGETNKAPDGNAPKPEPIENQFGTSMTANLKALSTQSIEAMQKEEEEEKKGGLLSRFKRS